jgi:hypothetical protein
VTLSSFASNLNQSDSINVYITAPNVPYRREAISYLGPAPDSNIYIFPNESSTLDAKLLDLECGSSFNCNITRNVSTDNISDAFSAGSGIVIALEALPDYSYSVANPFTPNVWNAFFVTVILLLLCIWAMFHFSHIDVQTKFGPKKTN